MITLVYSLNESLVSTVASEVESTLHRSGGKSCVFLLQRFPANNIDRKSKTAFHDIIASDPTLVHVELYETINGTSKTALSNLARRFHENL